MIIINTSCKSLYNKDYSRNNNSNRNTNIPIQKNKPIYFSGGIKLFRLSELIDDVSKFIQKLTSPAETVDFISDIVDDDNDDDGQKPLVKA